MDGGAWRATQSMGSQRVRDDWATFTSRHTVCSVWNKLWNGEGITKDLELCKLLHANKFQNLEDKDNFLGKQRLPKITPFEILKI